MYFEKVKLQYFQDAIQDVFGNDAKKLKLSTITKWLEELPLPQRATLYSAGYDFFMPYTLKLMPQSETIIPTGIRWVTSINDKNKVLVCVPRSGLGFKYGIRLSNSLGIIDADFYQSKTTGLIMMKLVNPSDQVVTLPKHSAFIQGIILPYYTTSDEIKPITERTGGLGSTSK